MNEFLVKFFQLTLYLSLIGQSTTKTKLQFWKEGLLSKFCIVRCFFNIVKNFIIFFHKAKSCCTR